MIPNWIETWNQCLLFKTRSLSLLHAPPIIWKIVKHCETLTSNLHQLTTIHSHLNTPTHAPRLPAAHVSVGPTHILTISINTLFSLDSYTLRKNPNIFKNFLHCFLFLFTYSLNYHLFYSQWHFKQPLSSPLSLLLLWRFSSPPPPLKICLRRLCRDPMPELPDPFRVRWPWLELRSCCQCSPSSSTESDDSEFSFSCGFRVNILLIRPAHTFIVSAFILRYGVVIIMSWYVNTRERDILRYLNIELLFCRC